MRRIFCLGVLCLLLTLAACHHEEEQQQAEVAANAAKVYYDYLLQGKFADFVSGMYFPDSLPSDYQKVLVVNAQKYVHRQDSIHRGIKEVNVGQFDYNEKDSTAAVYLQMSFADGAEEQVLVPMVCRRNTWYMR